MRRTQHLPTSEESRRNRLHAETRRENTQLRREVARLRRQLQKVEEHRPAEDETVPRDPQNVKSRDKSCPACGGPVAEVKLPTGVLRACRQCTWRKKG